MNVLDRIGRTGLVPVVVLENAEDAIPTARALLAGGIDVMEITMRTEAGIASIKAVSERVPEMLVGAGTVLTLEKCKESVEAGAKFIVSPGFDPIIVHWCIDNNITITPGCVTPTEIIAALNAGLKVVKYFPANIYGGVQGCKNLYSPFKSSGLKFIPTGGVNNDNLGDFADKPFIHAVGGGWLCNTAYVKNQNFAAITQIAGAAVEALLGFEVAHIGINSLDEESAKTTGRRLRETFGFPVEEGNSSSFATKFIEIMNSNYLGKNGHIAVRTNNILRAIQVLEKRGFEFDMKTAKYKGENIICVYMKEEIGGFAMHLLQK